MAAGAALERSPKRLDRKIGALVAQRKTAAWGYPPPISQSASAETSPGVNLP